MRKKERSGERVTRKGMTRRDFLKAGAGTLLAAQLGLGCGCKAAGHTCAANQEGRETLKSGIPLGGIGAGGVELRSDGLFYEWQIFNNWHIDKMKLQIEDAFFAFRAEADGEAPVCRVLATQSRAGLIPVDTIDYTGRFPSAQLDYHVQDSPCRVTLNAFSSFIPHDSKHSALPGTVFEFHVENLSGTDCNASLAFCLNNAVGYTEPTARAMSAAKQGRGWRGIAMSCENASERLPSDGTIVMASLSDDVSIDAGGDSAKVMKPFKQWGSVEEKSEASGTVGCPIAGAVSSSVSLKPGQTKTVTFILTWHFPHFIDTENIDISRNYTNWFDSASQAADYLACNLDDLKAKSFAFRDAFYRSNLPEWIIDAVNSQFTTLFKSAWWDKDGNFAIWEGLACCGMQTADVAYYGSFPLIMMFPDLAKQAMRLTARFQNPSGRIPHFFPGTFQHPDAYHMIDLMPKFALMVWRDYLWTGDRAYLDEMWPHVRAAMEHDRALDRNGDFLPDNHGIDQTYDGWEFEGASIYVGLIYVVGLKAAARMARLEGEDDLATQYDHLAQIAAASLDEKLWNGEYYDLFYDIATDVRDACCMADQMNGHWYSDMLQLGDVLPADKVQSSLASIYKYNRGDDCLYNGTWRENAPDHGGQWSAVWSGTEYMLASHMIYRGMCDEGLEIAQAVFDRHARDGLTWNHMECGEHYYRSMAVLTVLFGLQGFYYSALDGRMAVDPRINRDNHVSPFITPDAWGEITFKQKGQGAWLKIETAAGELKLNSVDVGVQGCTNAAIALGPSRMEARVAAEDGTAQVKFGQQIVVRPGLPLVLELS